MTQLLQLLSQGYFSNNVGNNSATHHIICSSRRAIRMQQQLPSTIVDILGSEIMKCNAGS
uniref:Uncharacterized protein n=1 Tax=Arundo donax TaxID=35708 RepID=A0A0A9ANB9_ARUDO